MTLVVRVPDSLRRERAYAAHVVLSVHLGIEYELVFEDRQDVLIHAFGDESRTLRVPDLVFVAGDKGWPATATRPPPPPRLLAQPDPEGEFNTDVFGTTFWYLTRLEELQSTQRDTHGRFPETASGDENQRPCVDELTDLFGSRLLQIWSTLNVRRHLFELVPTHDVDRPFKHLFQTPTRLLRRMVGDTLRGHEVADVLKSPILRSRIRRGELALDPFNTFDWLMDQSERLGVRSTFYFICTRDTGGIDGDYKIDDLPIRNLLKRVSTRGHAIGLHGTYKSAYDAVKLADEIQLLRRVCESEGIQLDRIRARQHVLRFDPNKTTAVWSQAGIDEDSTLGHAGRAGFRCGTCRSFPLFDIASRSMTKIVERPLIVMDVSLLEARYEGLSQAMAGLRIEDLAKRCRSVGGSFVLLWHNCQLENALARDTYSRALAAARNPCAGSVRNSLPP